MGHRTLEITLQYAKDLNNVNLITKMGVYAVVSISGGDSSSKQKTKTPVDHDGDANPNWNFPMTFSVDEAALQMNRLTLDFKLVCERALGDKDVGEVIVPIKELFDSPAKAGGEGQQFVSYQVRKPGGKPKGQLSFSYKFSENFAAAAASPYAAATPLAPSSGKADNGPITAYPSGSSSTYPPPGVYPPLPEYEGSGHYPPQYAAAEGSVMYPQPTVYPPAPPPSGGYHVYPPPPPSGGYGYPPPPPPGYGYPPLGYGHPPQPGHGYAPPHTAAQPPKKNKVGMGLGAGLLGGAIGGLLVGDMISDGGDFDSGGFDF